MPDPVQIRGDVGEARVDPETRTYNVYDNCWAFDRRRGPVSARHAEFEAEILRLRGMQAALASPTFTTELRHEQALDVDPLKPFERR